MSSWAAVSSTARASAKVTLPTTLPEVVVGRDLAAEIALGVHLGSGGVRGQGDAQLGVAPHADGLAEPGDGGLARTGRLGDLGDASTGNR